MWYESPTDLDDIFFRNVERYIELTRPTGNENFDAYVKNFYRKNLAQRKAELVKKMKSSAQKYHILDNFQHSITDYEYKVQEVNWPYQTEEERERNLLIYNFLCANIKPSTRKITLHRLKQEYFAAKAEVIAIDSTLESPELKEKIENLRLADRYYEAISRRFITFARAHQSAEIVKKYNLPRNFDRPFFEKHIQEIMALRKPREKESQEK